MNHHPLVRRANQLKETGLYEDAADLYVQYGEMLMSEDLKHEAYVAFSQAANCFIINSPQKAIIAYRAAIKCAVDAELWELAATCAYTAGSSYFTTNPPPMQESDAINFFLHAADLYQSCGLVMQAQQAFQYVSILNEKINCSVKK